MTAGVSADLERKGVKRTVGDGHGRERPRARVAIARQRREQHRHVARARARGEARRVRARRAPVDRVDEHRRGAARRGRGARAQRRAQHAQALLRRASLGDRDVLAHRRVYRGGGGLGRCEGEREHVALEVYRGDAQRGRGALGARAVGADAERDGG